MYETRVSQNWGNKGCVDHSSSPWLWWEAATMACPLCQLLNRSKPWRYTSVRRPVSRYLSCGQIPGVVTVATLSGSETKIEKHTT